MSVDHLEKQSCAAFAVIESLRLKFTSGNSVPVDRAIITRAEFDAIAAPARTRRHDRLKACDGVISARTVYRLEL